MESRFMLGVLTIYLFCSSTESSRYLTAFQTARNSAELFTGLINVEPITCFSTCEGNLLLSLTHYDGTLIFNDTDEALDLCKSNRQDEKKVLKGRETFLQDCDFFFNRTDVKMLEELRKTNWYFQRLIMIFFCPTLLKFFDDTVPKIESFNISTSETQVNEYLTKSDSHGFENIFQYFLNDNADLKPSELYVVNEIQESAAQASKQGFIHVLRKIRERNMSQNKQKYYLSFETTCSEEI